ETANLMLRLVRPGQRVLDLGAHLGSFALAAAAAGCRVAAVDASPRNVALLRASKEQNGFDALTVIHAAVGDRPGQVRFGHGGPFGQVQAREGGASGLGALARRALDFLAGRRRGAGPAVGPRQAGGVEVDALSADVLVGRLGWERVEFVKIDVEGFELQAV